MTINHFWHEDDGFRKSIILNQAIAASNSEHIIQIDGDSIIHKNFVKDHLKLASKNTYFFDLELIFKRNICQHFLKMKLLTLIYSRKASRKNSNITYSSIK